MGDSAGQLLLVLLGLLLRRSRWHSWGLLRPLLPRLRLLLGLLVELVEIELPDHILLWPRGASAPLGPRALPFVPGTGWAGEQRVPPTSEKVQDTARPFLSICGRRMISVPPWKRMRVGSCLVRGEVLTLYLCQDKPTVTLRQPEGAGGSQGLPQSGPCLPRLCSPHLVLTSVYRPTSTFPNWSPEQLYLGRMGTHGCGGHRGPQAPLPTKIPLGATHLRERSAKIGAKDWHSLDQLAKNSTIHVTRLSLSSSSCHEGMGLGGSGQSPPKPPGLGRYSHRWSCH